MSLYKNEPQSTSTSTSTSFSLSMLNNNTNTNKPPNPPNSKPLLDYYWTIIDEIHFPTVAIPCIYRAITISNNGNDKKETMLPHVCVRIIERSILTQFENMKSPEIKAYGCLLSVPCNQDEVDLLNEINTKDFNFGVEAFDVNRDSMVKLNDFRDFYNILIASCPVKSTSLVYNRPQQQQQQQMTTIQLQPISNLQVNLKIYSN